MKVTVETCLEIKDFSTPNFVLVEGIESEDGGKSPCIPLKELDGKTLSALCDNFREAIFSKANKQDPRTI